MKLFIPNITKKLILILSIATSTFALDIKTYFDLDIKALEISLRDSQRKLQCIKDNCSLDEKYSINTQTQNDIEDLFSEKNTTTSKHTGFYMQNKKYIDKYYSENLQLKNRYQSLINQIESINSKIKSLMESPQ